MRLTAGKLRLAGWLIIADIVAFVLFIVVGIFMAISAIKSGNGTNSSILSDPSSAPMILWTALMLLTVVYILLVFRELLSGWFNYDKANTLIDLMIGLTFITAPIAFLFMGLGKEISGWYTLPVNVIYTLLDLWLAVLVLKMPGDLFGYRKKIGVSGILLMLVGAVMAVALYMLQANNMQGAFLKVIAGITMLAGLVLTIYFVVILIRMFFKAARAVKQGQQAPTAV